MPPKVTPREDLARSSASTPPSVPNTPTPPADSVAAVNADDRNAETTDADIERRMVAAELAGRTTVADALARELEARRQARVGKLGETLAPSNVIAIGFASTRKS